MYPYETPFSDIMKINRQPVTELTQDVLTSITILDRLHRASAATGSLHTSVSNICTSSSALISTIITRLHRRPRFVRDDDGQKAFSKLRSSQRDVCLALEPQCPPEYARRLPPARRRSFARPTSRSSRFRLLPYSPEAVYRYVNFILQMAQARKCPDTRPSAAPL